jgi:ech hydrogenase subunit A
MDQLALALGLLILAPLAGAAVLALPIWRAIDRVVVAITLVVLTITLSALAVAFWSSGVVGQPIEVPVGLSPLDPAEPWAGVAWSLAPVAIGLVMLGIGVRARNVLLAALAAVGVALATAAAAIDLTAERHAELAPSLLLDPLSAVLLLVSAGVGSAIVVYALVYEPAHLAHRRIDLARGPRFIAWLLFFLSAMHLLVLADDLRLLTVGWELTTLCSFALIGFEADLPAVTAARRALAWNLAGGAGFAAAVVLAGPGGSLSRVIEWAVEGTGTLEAVVVPVILAGFVAGAAAKSALLPAHPWLLGAMVAAAPVSALLHASTMVKAGSYLMLRLSPAFAAEGLIGPAVALLGGLTFAVTALLALRERDLKRILALSTVSTLGLIAAAAGLGSAVALAAGVLLLLFHAVAKGLAFLTVGAMEQLSGTRDIEALVGIARRRPYLAGLLILAAGALVLPPFGIVVAKWALLVLGSGNLGLVVLLALGGAAGLVLWTAITARLLVRRTAPGPALEEGPPLGMGAPMAALGIATATGLALAAPVARAFADPAGIVAYAGDPGLASGWSIVLAGAGFAVPYLVALFTLAVVAVVLVVTRAPTTAPQPYLSGANVAAGPTTQFHGVRGRPVTATSGGFYWGVVPSTGPGAQRTERLVAALGWIALGLIGLATIGAVTIGSWP